VTTAPLAIVTGGKRRLGAEIAAKLAGAGYALALVSHMDAPPTDALAAALDAIRAHGTLSLLTLAPVTHPS